MKTVSFTRMEDGTVEDYALLAELEEQYVRKLPDRLMDSLSRLQATLPGYPITRLEHSLQSATRAYDACEPEEMVVAALLHDIGDELAPAAHSEMAAAILRPYVSERVYWIIKHHGLFQTYYYHHHMGRDRNAREVLKDHAWYQDCVDFCHNYDQNCFDPAFKSRDLEFFRPMVERVFSNPKPEFAQSGAAIHPDWIQKTHFG
ncbi:MAG: HD domain-containing protein [Gammaproteobacteria bacterium]|nr:HD domain-containing protein [Gammaproteobacteria bacterium]